MASPHPSDAANGISTPPTSNPAGTGGATGGSQQATQATSPRGTPPNQQLNTMSGAGADQSASSSAAAGAGSSQHPLVPTTSVSDSGLGKRPRDARLLHLVLAHQGVQSYEERVPLQLLDFAYRYTSSILSDALAISAEMPTGAGGRANKEGEAGGVTIAALRQAVACRAGYQFNATLPKEYLLELGAERNRVQLPRVDREWGMRLPSEKWTLTGTGWSLKDEWESEADEDDVPLATLMSEDVVMREAGDGTSGDLDTKDEDMEEFEEVMGRGDGMEM